MHHLVLNGIVSALLPVSSYAAIQQNALFNLHPSSIQPERLARGESNYQLEPSFSDTKESAGIKGEISLSKLAGVKELIILAADVKDKHLFYQRIRPGIEVIDLKAGSSGEQQLIFWLKQYRGLDAVHLVSHATAGTIHLGNERVNKTDFAHDSQLTDAINQAMKPGADLLFYGCELAANSHGFELVEIIKKNTHVDIAASNNLTGSRDLNGDWELEIHKGEVNTTIPFSEAALKDFSDVLAVDKTITMDGFTEYAFQNPATYFLSNYTPRLSIDDSNTVTCANSACYVQWDNNATGGKKLYFDFSTNQTFDITSLYLYSATSQDFTIESDNNDSTTVSLNNSGQTVNLNWTGITKVTIRKSDNTDIKFSKIDNLVLTNIQNPDSTKPIISEVTPVSTPTKDNTPDYIFTTDEAGTLAVGGSCGTSTSHHHKWHR